MSISHLALVPSQSNVANEFGETALNFAPTIRLSNGGLAVPQQFLDVSRTLDNLSNVLANISTPDHFQLFAGQEGSCLYLLVGVIGQENYPSGEQSPQHNKIVYGRRWMIEESTPTSEIIQTALLAVKKAREHEIRELVTLAINDGANRATPFNCHLDLPLMVGNQSSMHTQKVPNFSDLIKDISIAGSQLELVQSISLGQKCIVDVSLTKGQGECHFTELRGIVLTVVCEHADGRDFLHQLMATLIKHSDRYVEERVAFKGFHRFSHTLDVVKLAEFSYATRAVKAIDKRFKSEFVGMNYRVDAAKAPEFNSGRLGREQRQTLFGYDSLGGYCPR